MESKQHMGLGQTTKGTSIVSDIWLPPDYLERNESLRRAGILTFVTWSDVSQDPLGSDDLRQLAASLPAEALLTLISVISIIQTNTGWNLDLIRGQQRNLAQQICPPEIAQQIDRLIAQGRCDVLAHEEQLLIAAKLAVYYGQASPLVPERADEASYTLGKLLLGINELLLHGEGGFANTEQFLFDLALRRQARSRNEQIRYLVTRYYDLLVTRSRSQHDPTFELDQALYAETGLNVEEYIALACVYYLPFSASQTLSDLQARNFQHIIRHYERKFRSRRLAERVARLFSRDIAGFGAALQASGQDVLHASNLPFKQTPLFQMANRSALPLSVPFLIEKVTMGAYWQLLDHYSAHDPHNGVRNYIAYIGRLFQGYLSELLQRTYAGPGCTNQHFYSEQAILNASPQAPQGEQPPFDGLIVSGNSLIIIEMSAVALPVTVMERADPVQFEAVIRRSFEQKIEQLNRAFEGLANATWDAPGLERQHITHVYPVLALLHPFPQTGATWAQLKAVALPPIHYAFGGTLLQTQVHEPQIITAEEFEMLEPLLSSGQLSLPDLLQRKLATPDISTKSMKDFLLTSLQIEEQANEPMLALYQAFMKQMLIVLEKYTRIGWVGKSVLISRVAQRRGKSKKETGEGINTILEVIREALHAGEKVHLAGFGTFEVKIAAARAGIHPQTRARMRIPAKNRVRFSSSKKLTRAIST
jgi:DNA-binding protein HU-beta